MKMASKLCLFFTLVTILFSVGSCKKATPSTCTAIAQQTATNVSYTSATLKWTGSSSPYSIQYRGIGIPVWATTTSLVDSLMLTGLDASITYEWRVKGACDTTYSSLGTFTTIGCGPQYTGPHCDSCIAGYEGSACMTQSRAKYLGNWTANGVDNASPQNTYPNLAFVLTPVAASVTKILMSVNGLAFNIILASNGTSFTVEQTTSGNYTYSGHGTFTSANTFTLLLTEVGGSPTTTTVYTFTGTK